MTITPFGWTSDGRDVQFITLKPTGQAQGPFINAKAVICTLGASLAELWLPGGSVDSGLHLDDCVLGYDSVKGYEVNPVYHGAVVGRVAGRISPASFKSPIKKQLWALTPKDSPETCLHGGKDGMSHKLWRITRHSDNSVTLTYLSPHLESGFPGRLEVYVTYTLECPPASNGNSAQLSLDYSAQLLAESLIRFDETPINLSNHAYWNLAGHLSGPNQLAEHLVEIKGHRLVELDKTTLLPTGNLLEPSPEAFEHLVVPLDQPDKRPLKDGLQGIDQPDGRTGYDHFYLFDFPCDKAERELASVWHKASRRRLCLYTNQPGLQFYTGNFLDPKSDPQGKQGTSYQPHAGLCLETGGYPNACNVDSFPVNWLTTTNGGDSEPYRHQTRLLFDLYDGVVDSS